MRNKDTNKKGKNNYFIKIECCLYKHAQGNKLFSLAYQIKEIFQF